MTNIVLGSKVKLIGNDSGSVNDVGFVGFVTEVPEEKWDKTVRVSKTPVNDTSEGNWSAINELEIVNEKAEVTAMSDGWRVEVNNKFYSWNHNEPDLGTFALKDMLNELGFETNIIEEY
jgi:hypothetical protein